MCDDFVFSLPFLVFHTIQLQKSLNQLFTFRIFQVQVSYILLSLRCCAGDDDDVNVLDFIVFSGAMM
jgi:hypothetical protein